MKTYDTSRLIPVKIEDEIKAVAEFVQSQWDCTNIFHRNPELNSNAVESLVKDIYGKVYSTNQFGTSLHAVECLPDYAGQRREYLSRELNISHDSISHDAIYNLVMNATLSIDSYNGDLYESRTCNMLELTSIILKHVYNDYIGIDKTYPKNYSEFLDVFRNAKDSGYNQSEEQVKAEASKFNGHTEYEGQIPDIVTFSSLFNVAYDECEEDRKPAYTLAYYVGRHFLTVCKFNNECTVRTELDSINNKAPYSNDELKTSLPFLSAIMPSSKYKVPLIKLPTNEVQIIEFQSKLREEENKLKNKIQNGTVKKINKFQSTPSRDQS